MSLKDEARDELQKWWARHPQAYIKLRKEQMESCKFKNGKVMKKHREAYDYYALQIFLFELVHGPLKKRPRCRGQSGSHEQSD